MDGSSSIEQLVQFTPTMLQEQEGNTLFRLKRAIKDTLSIGDLQGLTGKGTLSSGIYDFYTEVLREFLKLLKGTG